MGIKPRSQSRSSFFADPVNEVRDILPDINSVAEGHLIALKSDPPTFNLKKNGVWETIEIPEGTQFRLLASNKEYTRTNDELQLTNDDLDLPFILRLGLSSDFALDTITPTPLFYADLGETLYPYPIPFDQLDATLARGSWSDGKLFAASNEGIDPQVTLLWQKRINTSDPVRYVGWEVSSDGVTWSIAFLLWEESSDKRFYTESCLFDIKTNNQYRVTAFLSRLASDEDTIVASLSRIDGGRNSEVEQNAIANASILLPPIISTPTYNNQALNLVDISYEVTIQAASATPTTLNISLFAEGEAIAIETKPQITTGINPGQTLIVNFLGVDGFNGGTPKKFFLRAEVN